MPITPELIQKLKASGITAQDIDAEIQNRQSGGVNGLMSQLMPKQNAGTGVGDFLTRLGGGKPGEQTDLSKLVAGEAIKKQFADPLDAKLKEERIKGIEAGLMTDENGDIIKRPTAPKPMSSFGVADTDERTPEEIYSGMNPGNKSLIDKVASYDVNPMSIPGMNNQARTELLKLVSALHPDYSQANYATKAASKKDFTSGPSAAQIQAINTSTKHAGRIGGEMKSLGNWGGPMAVFNPVKNAFQDMTGGGKQKATALSINATFDELATALKKSGATDTTITNLKHRIDENMSPEAQQEILKTIGNLLSDQETSLQSRYKEGQFHEHQGSFFDPYGQKVLAEITGQQPEFGAIPQEAQALSPSIGGNDPFASHLESQGFKVLRKRPKNG